MGRHVVGHADELPPGARAIVEVNGRSVGIFNVGDDYFALRNICPHQGGPLCAGSVWSGLDATSPGNYEFVAERKSIRCPWHGWEFDLGTGRSWFDPQRTRVRSYEVRVERGATLTNGSGGEAQRLEGPYVAETYSLVAEGEYLVLEMP